MTDPQLLALAAQTLRDSIELERMLESAPAIVRNNSNVQRARAVGANARTLIGEFVRRVRAERSDDDDKQQAGARLPQLP